MFNKQVGNYWCLSPTTTTTCLSLLSPERFQGSQSSSATTLSTQSSATVHLAVSLDKLCAWNDARALTDCSYLCPRSYHYIVDNRRVCSNNLFFKYAISGSTVSLLGRDGLVKENNILSFTEIFQVMIIHFCVAGIKYNQTSLCSPLRQSSGEDVIGFQQQ